MNLVVMKLISYTCMLLRILLESTCKTTTDPLYYIGYSDALRDNTVKCNSYETG